MTSNGHHRRIGKLERVLRPDLGTAQERVAAVVALVNADMDHKRDLFDWRNGGYNGPMPAPPLPYYFDFDSLRELIDLTQGEPTRSIAGTMESIVDRCRLRNRGIFSLT